MRVAGIDPGISGAIGLLDERRFVAVTDLPTRNKFQDNEKQQIEAKVLTQILLSWMPERVVIEHVHASPTYGGKPDRFCQGCKRPFGLMSPASAFNFGDSFGMVKGIVETLSVIHRPKFELVLIGPVKWKNLAGLRGEDKEASRQLALSVFPDSASYLARKGDDNRAESLLIALYGGYQQGHEIPTGGKRRRRTPQEQMSLT